LCHQVISGKLTHSTRFAELANSVSLNGPITDLNKFAQDYIDVFAKGYNYAFGVAAIAMLISLLVYIFFNKMLPNKEVKATTKEVQVEKSVKKIAISVGTILAVGFAIFFAFGNADIAFAFGLFAGFVIWMLQASNKEERPRVTALLLVFVVVIFFWMSFHQNGLTQ